MDNESHSQSQRHLINTADGGQVLSETGNLHAEQVKPISSETIPSQRGRKSKRHGRHISRRSALALITGAGLVGAETVYQLTRKETPVTFVPPEIREDKQPLTPFQKLQELKKTTEGQSPTNTIILSEIEKAAHLDLIFARVRKYYERYKGDSEVRNKAAIVQQEIQQALLDPRLAALKLNEQDRVIYTTTLLATAALESRFMPEVENGAKLEENKAIGLLQVKNASAAEQARRLGIQGYDLKNIRDNIVLSVAIMDRYRRLFPKLGLMLAAYNLGEGKVQRAIQIHAKQDLHMQSDKVDNDFATMGKDGKSSPATVMYTRDLGITNHDLMLSPNVVRDFRAQDYKEEELDYFDRFIAWAMVLNPKDFQGITQLMIENSEKPKENIWEMVKQVVRR